ncbi:MAG: hypothetical protein DRO93_07955 [Candidatus Thorarchaeota archaeon]|nr:MAG: hypothetical protein DRO93_07955 [Candidatus Thorarchaeota archaeon]
MDVTSNELVLHWNPRVLFSKTKAFLPTRNFHIVEQWFYGFGTTVWINTTRPGRLGFAHRPHNNEQWWLYLTSLSQSSVGLATMLAAGQIAQPIVVVGALSAVHFSKRDPVKERGLLLAGTNSFGQILYHLRRLLLGNPYGDEYYLSYPLHVPVYAITVPLLIGYTIGSYLAIRVIESWRFRARWSAAVLVALVPMGILLMSVDSFLREQINYGNPFSCRYLGSHSLYCWLIS